MAQVVDRWHLSRPSKNAQPCGEHSTRNRVLVPSADHGSGLRYQVRYRDASGRQRKENFEKKGEADRRAAAVKTDLDRGEYIDRAAGRETFRAVAERWRMSAVHRPSTADRVATGLNLHVYPAFGDAPIASIKRSDIQAWIKAKSAVLAPVTVANTYALIRTVLRAAVHDGALRSSPCDGIRLPRRRQSEVVPPSEVAVRALIDAAPTMRQRALTLLAAASGLRQGELFGLEVGHIDFLRRTVTVQQQLVCVTGKGSVGPHLGPVKTHESNRTVPLTKTVVDMLAAYLRERPAQEVEIWDRTDPRKPRKRPAKLLFPNEQGRPLQRSPWARTWAATVKRANAALAESESDVRVQPGTTLHDLRHFYASLLIKHRESVKTVQKRLGHATASITLNTYTHLWPDENDTTRAAVDAVLGDVPAECPARIAG